MDFAKINELAKSSGYLETKKLSELEPEKKYLVTNLRKVATKFGCKVVMDLDKSFSVFLPARINKAFEGDNVKNLEVCSTNRLYFKYLGGQHHFFEFICE